MTLGPLTSPRVAALRSTVVDPLRSARACTLRGASVEPLALDDDPDATPIRPIRSLSVRPLEPATDAEEFTP